MSYHTALHIHSDVGCVFIANTDEYDNIYITYSVCYNWFKHFQKIIVALYVCSLQRR